MFYLQLVAILVVATIASTAQFVISVLKLNIDSVPEMFKRDIVDNFRFYTKSTANIIKKQRGIQYHGK